MADDDKTDKKDEPNKAQVEFERYIKRMREHGGRFTMPGGPGWAVPPSVAILPGPGGRGFFAAIPQGGGFGEGSLTHRLGATLRLSVDVVNAALAGGVRFLNGVADIAYGGPDNGYAHEGCGCGCSCCEDSCRGQDCCGCECCRSSVGTCC